MDAPRSPDGDFPRNPAGSTAMNWASLPAFAESDQPVLVFDPDRLRIVWANRAAAVLWRAASLEELVRRDFSNLSEASRIRVRAALARLQQSDTIEEQFTLHTPEGPVSTLAELSSIGLPDGRRGILSRTLRVLRELHGEPLRAVEALRQISAAVSLFAPDGTAIMRNPAAFKAFGNSSGPRDYERMLSQPELGPSLAALLEQERFEGRLMLNTAGGRRWHHVCSHAMLDPENGEPVLLLESMDISEQVSGEELLRAQEERLRALKDQAEQASESKTRFLAAASHDLRQPLHALGMFVTLLRTQANTPSLKELTEKIRASVGSLSDLIDGLLDLSRLDAGTVRPEVREFPLDSVLDRLRTFEAPARDKGLNFRVGPSALWVRSDPALLERILINLVSNAVRYTRRGHVLVGTRREGQSVRVMVADTGPGIPADRQQSIFEEFVQLERGTGNKGLGLGLAIVQRLGRLLDHPVGVISGGAGGSTFWVEIPVVRAGQLQSFTTTQQHAASRRLAGLLIAVVDDDQTVREAVAQVLKSWSCEVIEADDGDSLMERIGAVGRAPDVLLCDYRLENGKTGFEVMDRLERERGRCPVTALITADTHPEVVALARDRNIPLLHKPLSASRLYEALTGLL